MTAYYNELDPYAAEWLRNLIAAGHIAPGDVDERDIRDVYPDDLRGYTQCHFFAGIGVWSYALRRAGWPDDRPVWTGSCPCQPFSSAGQGLGFDDERHLWPAFHHLIRERRPAAILGEQVASKNADPWIDLVQANLEALGYAFGAVPFPAASIGAPHIRDRLYWMANANGIAGRQRGSDVRGRLDGGNASAWAGSSGSGLLGRLEYSGQHHDPSKVQAAGVGQSQTNRPTDQLGGSGISPRRLGDANDTRLEGHREGSCSTSGHGRGAVRPVAATGESGRLADAIVQQRSDGQPRFGHEHDEAGREQGPAATAGLCGDHRAGPVNGFWRAADWLGCRDGKWRPVEPGTFPLAASPAARVGRLRAYGNAICAEAATEFIAAAMTAIDGDTA